MSVGLVSRTIRPFCRLVGAHRTAIKNFGKQTEDCLPFVDTLRRSDAAVYLTRNTLIWRARGVAVLKRLSAKPKFPGTKSGNQKFAG